MCTGAGGYLDLICIDADNDGAWAGCECPPSAPVDCDDDDDGVRPSAPELCNNVDDDCDGSVDEGCAG